MMVLKCYLKEHFGCIGVTLLYFSVFAAVLRLYSLPVKAAFYPAVLSLVLAVVISAFDLARFKRRHDALSGIKEHPSEERFLTDDGCGLIESDLIGIIEKLKEENEEAASAAAISQKERTDYYTAWAHQIKTPISSMYLMLEGEDSPLSRNLRCELSRIEQYAEMALTYLKLDSDTNDLVLREHSLDGMLKHCVKRFSSEFITRRISLDLQETGATLVTDDKWFCFITEQFLSNSLKYTNASGRISVFLSDEKTLCIKDTGIGIAASDLPRVFEKGFTGLNGRQDKKATGIGLYLCKEVADRLGLTLSIDSGKSGTSVFIGFDQYVLKGE